MKFAEYQQNLEVEVTSPVSSPYRAVTLSAEPYKIPRNIQWTVMIKSDRSTHPKEISLQRLRIPK